LTTIAEKDAWLESIERDLNWTSLIKTVLEEILPLSEHCAIEPYYHALFRRLHRAVHPSVFIRKRTEQSAQLMLDTFDPAWAEETIQEAKDVFDIIWLAVFKRYPRAAASLSTADAFHHCIRTRTLLSQAGHNNPAS
jgi:hypothetical protein